jgi:hypothetical protein
MAVLNFTLSPEAVSKLNNVLVCLGRFSDSVCIESNKDHVRLNLLGGLVVTPLADPGIYSWCYLP